MGPETVMLILYLFFAFVVVIAFLTGLRRGLRKSLYWLIVCVTFFILLFTTMNVASKGIYNGVLKDVVVDLLIKQLNLDAEVVANPDIMNQVYIIGQIVVKIFYFIGLWILYYLVAWILWLSVFKRLLIKAKYTKEEKKAMKLAKKNRKKETKQERELRLLKEEEKHPAPKKRRLFGGLVGVVRGAMSSFIILCVINSVVGILPTIERNETASTEEDVLNQSFYDYLIEKVPGMAKALDYIEVYQDSTLNKITKFKINGTTVDVMFTDSFLSGSFKTSTGKKVKLNLMQEIKNWMIIGTKAYDLTNGFDMKSVKFTNLSLKQQNLVVDILQMMSKDSFLMGAIPAIIAYGLIDDDISKDLTKLGIDNSTFKEVNWANDILVVSQMVKDVYALSDTYDLNKIDYMDMDINLVDSIFNSISRLTVLQPSMKIATDQLLQSKAFKEVIGDIQIDFSDIVWSDEIVNINQIYKDFIDVGFDALLDETKDENGKNNILKALTALNEQGHEAAQHLIDTIFNSVFVEKVMPYALEIAVSKIKDPELKEMINFDVIGEDGWANELSTVLQLIKEISNSGEYLYDKFDFKMINSISVDTLLQSKLLENASISLLVDSANGKGLLKDSIGKYIDLPDALKVEGPTTGKNNPAWKDQVDTSGQRIDGELRKALTPLKEILDQINDLNNIVGSIPDIVNVIDETLIDSTLVYYSLNKSLPQLYKTKTIVIPVSSYDEHNMMKKEEMVDLFESLKLVPFDELIAVKTPAEGEDGETKHVFINDTNAIMRAIMKIEDMENFLEADILRATVSYYMDQYAKDFIVLPDGSYQVAPVYIDESETKDINLITKKDLSQAIKALSYLKDENGNLLDFTTLEENPEQIINYLNPQVAQLIFIQPQTYSSIIHATISKYLLDYDYDGTIVVPSSAIQNGQYIKGQEIVNLVQDFKDLNITDFNAISEDPMSIMKNIDETIAQNIFLESNQNTYSSILHATVSKYLLDPLTSEQIVIPPSIIETIDGDQIISGQEIVQLITIAKKLGLEELDKISFDTIDIEKIYTYQDDIVSSYILKASTTKYLQEANLVEIPKSAFDFSISEDVKDENTSYYLTQVEFKTLIASLKHLGITDLQSLKTFNISTIDVNQIVTYKDTFKQSSIIRKMVTVETKKALGNEALPSDCLDQEMIITETEFGALIQSLKTLNITNLENGIEVNRLTLDLLSSDDYAILNSVIIWNAISNEINGLSNTLVLPSDIYSTEIPSRIAKSEIMATMESLKILGINQIANFELNFEKDELSISNLNQNLDQLLNSKIIHANMSSQLSNMNQENIIVPDSIYESENKVYVIKEEFKALFNSFEILGINQITSTALESLTNLNIKTINENMTELLNSQVIHYSISDQIIAQEELVIKDEVYENKANNLLTKVEIQKLFHSLSVLNMESFTHVDVESLVRKILQELQEAEVRTILDSYILEKTASQNVKTHYGAQGSIFVLPENQKVYNADKSQFITIDYANEDIDKEELVALIISGKTLGFTDLAVQDFAFEDFLNKGVSDQELRTILKSKINSYNLGIQISQENESGRIFNQLLVIPDDPNWFSFVFVENEEVIGDVYPFISSMKNIYADAELKPLFEAIAKQNESTALVQQSDLVYEKLADYTSNGRILLNTIPNMANKFLSSYTSSGNNLIDKNKIVIPLNESEAYWRGNTGSIKDGELYKFFIAINRVTNYKSYTTVESLENAINDIRKSTILKTCFDEDVLFGTTTVTTFNAYLQLQGKELLPAKELVVTETDYQNYIHQYATVAIEISTQV